jgi:hypothetical protein
MEGRRGGLCHQLGVLVQGRWRACPFAAPLFAAPASDTSSMLSLQAALELEALPADTLLALEEHPDPIPGLIASNSYSV